MKQSQLTDRDKAEYSARQTSLARLASKYHVTVWLIRKWLRQSGVHGNPTGRITIHSKLSSLDVQRFKTWRVTVNELSESYGVDVSLVRRWLRQAGVRLRNGGPPRFDLAKLVSIVSRRELGESLLDVAKSLGVSKQCVSQHVANSVLAMLTHEVQKLRNGTTKLKSAKLDLDIVVAAKRLGANISPATLLFNGSAAGHIRLEDSEDSGDGVAEVSDKDINKDKVADIEHAGDEDTLLFHFLNELPLGEREIVKNCRCKTPRDLAEHGAKSIRKQLGANAATTNHIGKWLKEKFGLDLAE